MMRTKSAVLPFLSAILLVLSAILLACSGPSLLMRPATASDEVRSESTALVTIIAPQGLRDIVTIVDEMGRYRGQVAAHTQTTFEIEPGSHRIYAFLNDTEHLVEGQLQARAHYWIRAERPLGGRFSWLPWQPACDASTRAEIGSARAMVVDRGADRVLLLQDLGNVPQRVRDADTEFDTFSADEQAMRTMRVAPECED